MSNSINTNPGAFAALASMRSTQGDLSVASKQVQTGYRVADAADDAAVFAVAQGVRGDLQAHEAIQSSLSNGIGLAEVSRSALEKMTDMVNNMQQTFAELSDGTIPDQGQPGYEERRVPLIRKMQQFFGQILQYIDQATYNGSNLISAGSTSKSFVADIDGSQISLSSLAAVKTATDTFRNGGHSAFTSAASIDSNQVGVPLLARSIQNALGTVAAEARALRSQLNFVNSIVDAKRSGLGAIVDSDVGKASASVQALQVRQQLGVQSLSVANQQPSVLLGMLR